MITEVCLIQDYSYSEFVLTLKKEIGRMQEDGYEVDVQYGGKGSSGPHTVLLLARTPA